MLRVLIVDDELDARDIMISCINWEAHGMKVAGSADNGLSALELIQEIWPDVVLMDVQMRGMNGLEVIERVRRSDCQQPVFIVISGYDDFVYLQKAIQLKVDGYLLKPFRPQDVLDIIQQHMWDMGIDKGQPTLGASFGSALLHVLGRPSARYQYPYEAERTILSAVRQGDPYEIEKALSDFAANLRAQTLDDDTLVNCYLILYAELVRNAVRPITPQDLEEARWNEGDAVGSMRRLLYRLALVINAQISARERHHTSPASRARDFIDAHYAQRLTLTYVADQIGITPTYLSSCFVDEYGIGFIDYIKNVRVVRARELLEGERMSIEDVAYACGYPDAKYFRQVFRQLTGKSPAAYRDMIAAEKQT